MRTISSYLLAFLVLLACTCGNENGTSQSESVLQPGETRLTLEKADFSYACITEAYVFCFRYFKAFERRIGRIRARLLGDDLYVYELRKGELRRLTHTLNEKIGPRASGSRVIWQEEARDDSLVLFLYDLLTDQKSVLVPQTKHWGIASFHEDKILYTDDSKGPRNEDVYLYDLRSKMIIPVDTARGGQYAAGMHGDLAVWLQLNDKDPRTSKIVMADLRTGKRELVSSVRSNKQGLEIHGDKIVWLDDRYGDLDLLVYNTSSREEVRIPGVPSHWTSPAVHDRWIVWVDKRHGNSDIYAYDWVTKREFPVCVESHDQAGPAVHGDKVVWSDDRFSEEGFHTVLMADLPELLRKSRQSRAESEE